MTVGLDAPDLLVRFAIAVLRVVRRFVAAVELDVLGVTVFSCSEASPFINGQIVYVGGGMISVLQFSLLS